MADPRVPGPWLAKLTILPLLIREAFGRRLDGLHALYGRVVQTGPRRISVNDAAGLRDVFLSTATRRLDRDAPVVFLHNYATENLVSTVDGDVHHQRRKVIRSVYSATLTGSAELRDVIAHATEGFLALEEQQRSGSQDVDVKPLLRLALADVMSHVVYGADHGTDTLRDPEQRRLFQKDVDFQEWRMKWSVSTAMSLLAPRLTLWLRDRGWSPKGLDDRLVARPYSDKLGRDALRALQTGQVSETTANASQMERMYRSFVENGPTPAVPSLDYILSDCMDHFWAGVNTTLDSLVSLFEELNRPKHQSIRRRLQTELREAAEAAGGPPSNIPADELKRLPLLDAVIRETLRLKPPFTFSLERRVTERQGSIDVAGYTVPAGWIVGATPDALHRHPAVFPQADAWDPDRWLSGNTQAAQREMRKHFYAFGAGPRMCIGVNVAWTMMRGIVAGVYGRDVAV